MIYYIHGYLSSPDGTKGQLFKKTLNATPIKYRDVEPENLVIKDCIKQIGKEISQDKNCILIGSSLGGLLAAKISLIQPISQLILLNPAIIPPTFDVSKIKDMPQRIAQEMYDKDLFTTKIDTTINIFLGTNDEVVPNNWGVTFAKKQEGSIQFLYDDHQFSSYINQLPEYINEILIK